jgi:nucleoside-diphosphate-sugar epimerase
MILVTGGAGVVGARLIRRLAADGVPHAGFTGDVRDHDALAAAVRPARAVVHLAAKHVDRDGTGFACNVAGARNLAAVAGDRRVVALSTTGVYGHAPHRDADEDTPLAPDTPQSRARAEADEVLLDQLDDALILRHRFVYGPGDVDVLPRLWRTARRLPVWPGDGAARLSLVHVDDLALALLEAARRDPAPGQRVFHVTDGRPMRLDALVAELCARWGGRSPRLRVPLAAVRGPVRLLERLLGVDPEASPLPVSSIRLDLVATEQSFANARFVAWMPDLRFRTLQEALAEPWAAHPPTAPAGARPTRR